MRGSNLEKSSRMILSESSMNTPNVFVITRIMRDSESILYKENFTTHVLYVQFPFTQFFSSHFLLYSMIKVDTILFPPSTRFLDSSDLLLIDFSHISRSLIPTVPH